MTKAAAAARFAGAATLVGVLIWAGVLLRVRLWDWTMHVRFIPDINNGYNWGKEADRVGYLNLYETLGKPERGKRYVDYAPLRPGVMSAWEQWLKAKGYPLVPYRQDPFQQSRGFHAPLLSFNLTMELLAATAAALLVWHVRRRSSRPDERPWAMAMSVLAFALVWFNPASMYEAHAWPQWDVWPMPFFLFALYCGFRRRWLVAGVLIGAGSMLKGQILTVGWTLPLWALCIGDWRGAGRAIIGASTAILLIGSPWIFSSLHPATRLRVIHWPAIELTALATLAAFLLPRRVSPSFVSAVLAVGLYTSMRFLGGNDLWLRSSFEVGTWNYQRMFMGPTSNLASHLDVRYGWNDINHHLFTLPALAFRDAGGVTALRLGGDVTLRTLLLTIFFGLSVLCVVRAAWLDRARDDRVLLALTLPWVLFFVIPCQIHERYLIFGAMCSATWVVSGVGMTLMGVLLSLVAAIHVVHCSLGAPRISPMRWSRVSDWPFPMIRQWLEGTHPGIAWLLMLAVLVLLYNILTPSRRRTTEPTG